MEIKKGVAVRMTIHNILYEIYKHNKIYDDISIKKKIIKNNEKDISLINNVCLNSMRYIFHSKKIINLYSKKKSKLHELILFNSAITQIVFLEFKDYAVINCTVEIAKKLNIYPGFVNALLKKISNDKSKLKLININFSELPYWFTEKTKDLKSNEKISFLKNFYNQPDLHIVFKNSKSLNNFEEDILKTSNVSGFIKKNIKIDTIPSFKNGDWWVQDFSSSLPLINISNKLLKNKIIDLCSAPGGKSFQVLSKGKKVILNDISKSRIDLLKTNLNRLKFKTKITNQDVLKINLNSKFDFIILDAPCSAVGTIRRNPEIFYRTGKPNFQKLINLQEKLLNKASLLLNKNGVILYMVCSFIKSETIEQINKFLLGNKNFCLNEFYIDDDNKYYNKFVNNNLLITLPEKIKGFNIDGYFAAYIKKIS